MRRTATILDCLQLGHTPLHYRRNSPRLGGHPPYPGSDSRTPSLPLKTCAYQESARAFREQMQTKAAHDNRWHLYAIMQHSTNSGSVSWQNAIHALVVEAITRDPRWEGIEEHKFLGKALNGLLPRRARLEDLKGENGWTDLAWLLELNQGFYNAASLAAVCSLGKGGWLGPPIRPVVGNERLEPIVHRFQWERQTVRGS